jgi:hypothetical protein
LIHICNKINSTVKLGDKERFDKLQIGVKDRAISSDQYANLHHKGKEHLVVRNNFRVTKKFDCRV